MLILTEDFLDISSHHDSKARTIGIRKPPLFPEPLEICPRLLLKSRGNCLYIQESCLGKVPDPFSEFHGKMSETCLQSCICFSQDIIARYTPVSFAFEFLADSFRPVMGHIPTIGQRTPRPCIHEDYLFHLIFFLLETVKIIIVIIRQISGTLDSRCQSIMKASEKFLCFCPGTWGLSSKGTILT